MRSVQPSIDSISFSCPHCGAHADQFWFNLHAKEIAEHGVPFRFDTAEFAKFLLRDNNPRNDGADEHFEEVAKRTENGDVFFLDAGGQGVYGSSPVVNLDISRCYSCKNLSVWIDRRVAYPVTNFDGVPPNEDLPPDIKRDFNEARAILSASPRGTAALLRLCIQKVCKHLGEPGENINSDIASLVRKGLDVRVQQALDIVRVIGNDSVHPGQFDLRDDPATAARLFELVNLIAERMISEPRRVDEMFNALPEAKKRAIEARDKPKP